MAEEIPTHAKVTLTVEVMVYGGKLDKRGLRKFIAESIEMQAISLLDAEALAVLDTGRKITWSIGG